MRFMEGSLTLANCVAPFVLLLNIHDQMKHTQMHMLQMGRHRRHTVLQITLFELAVVTSPHKEVIYTKHICLLHSVPKRRFKMKEVHYEPIAFSEHHL